MDRRKADTFAGFILRRTRCESARINDPSSSIVKPSATATETGPSTLPIRRTILTARRSVIVVDPVACAILIKTGAIIRLIIDCAPRIIGAPMPPGPITRGILKAICWLGAGPIVWGKFTKVVGPTAGRPPIPSAAPTFPIPATVPARSPRKVRAPPRKLLRFPKRAMMDFPFLVATNQSFERRQPRPIHYPG